MLVQKRRSPVGASRCRGGHHSDMLEFGAKEAPQTMPKRHGKPCQRGTANHVKRGTANHVKRGTANRANSGETRHGCIEEEMVGWRQQLSWRPAIIPTYSSLVPQGARNGDIIGRGGVDDKKKKECQPDS
jgi:hypothetical protein